MQTAPNTKKVSRIIKIIGLPLMSLILFFPVSVFAASVDLKWVANTEPDLSSYNIYYGTASRAYGSPIPLGNVTSRTIDGLIEGQTYYFALTAQDTSGNESGYSSEISAKARSRAQPGPVSPATPPNRPRIAPAIRLLLPH